MAAKLRRLLAALFLTVVVSPAHAIFPLGFGLGLVSGISTSGLTLPTVLSAVGIGSLVAMVSMHDTTSTPSASNQAVSVMLNPKSELPKRPAGWAPPASGSVQPVGPNQTTTQTQSTSTQYAYRTSSIYPSTRPTPEEACQASNACWHATGDGWCSTTAPCGPYGVGQMVQISTVNMGLGCPSGWTLSAGQCTKTVTAPTTAKPVDNHCTVMRVGNLFSADPYDPDCSVSGSDPSNNVTISGDGQTVVATLPDGSSIHVNVQPDGTAVITDTRPVNGGAQTQETKVQVSAPDSSTGQTKVIGKSTSTYEGSGTQKATSPNSTVSLDKTGLATEGTQSGIKSVLDSIDGKLTPTGSEDTTLSVAKTALDNAAVAHTGIFSDLTSGTHGFTWDWLPDIPASGACSNPTVNVKGASLTVDFCTAAGYTREALSWLIYIFGGFMIFNILTGRKEA